MVDFLLPPGADSLEGARCGGGWMLTWGDHRVDAWSPESGWLSLPDPPKQVDSAHPVDAGMAVVCKRAGRIGFWEYGRPDWRWWCEVSSLGSAAKVLVSPGLVFLYESGYPDDEYHFNELTRDGVRQWLTKRDQSLPRVFHAWRDEKEDTLKLLNTDGLHVLKHPFDESVDINFESVWNIGPDSLLHEVESPLVGTQTPVKVGNRAFFERHRLSALELNLETGGIGSTALGYMKGLRALWSAYANADRPLAGRIVEFLGIVPESPGRISSEGVFDLLVARSGQMSLATESGIFPPVDIGALAQPGERRSDSDLLVNEAELTTWRLWAYPEASLSSSYDVLIHRSMFSGALLAEAIARAGGQETCSGLLDYVRGKEIPWHFRESGVRSLFGRFGAGVAGIVRQSLEDDDVFVSTLAAAAAGAVENDRPLIWDQHEPPPAEQLVRLLSSPDEPVRRIVLDTIAHLRLGGDVVDAVGEVLSDNEDSVREYAVQTLKNLPGVAQYWKLRVEKLALEDPDDDVREEAVKALHELFRGPETIDVLIRVLGDHEWSPRSEVCEVVVKHASELSVEQFYRMADAVVLLLMAASLAKKTEGLESSDFSLGVDDFLDDLMEKITDPLDAASDAAVLPERLQDVLMAGILHLLFLQFSLSGDIISTIDQDEIEEIAEVAQAMGKDQLVSVEDMQDFKASPSGMTMARMANKIAAKDPELGVRLAVIANFCLKDSMFRGDNGKSDDGVPDEQLPLHRRLRRLSKSKGPAGECQALVAERGKSRDIDGMVALYSLAICGDEQARKELIRRAMKGETGEWKMVVNCLMALLEGHDRVEFMSEFLASEDVSLPLRAWWMKHWDEDELGTLSAIAKSALRRDIAASDEVALKQRVEAACGLADEGDGDPLERLWEAVEANDRSNDRFRVECAVKLVLGGHTQHMEWIRNHWKESGNPRLLEAFSRFGTLDDIPLLKGKSKGSTESWVGHTIEQIRARCALGE